MKYLVVLLALTGCANSKTVKVGECFEDLGSVYKVESVGEHSVLLRDTRFKDARIVTYYKFSMWFNRVDCFEGEVK